ncbi:MAG: universal stress protein [Cyanobacteria bacterium]|nr:universal stress protein [Cyanobacteriota bacterium]
MKVLIAVDNSECSTKAVKHCQDLSWPANTEFEVLTVIDATNEDDISEEPESESTKNAQLMVDNHISSLKKSFPQFKFGKKVLDGYTKGRILDHAIDSRADLIVVGSHGRTGFAKLLLGSVSQTVLCHALCPVRIVRNGHEGEAHQGVRVLICLDDSKYSRAALERIIEYKWPENTEFTCLTVLNTIVPVSPFESTSPSSAQLKEREVKLRRKIKSRLDEVSKKLSGNFPENKVETVIIEGDPRKEILAFAKSIDADLIVMGSHGRALLDRMLLGSVSEAVAHHADCSVEVVRGKQDL